MCACLLNFWFQTQNKTLINLQQPALKPILKPLVIYIQTCSKVVFVSSGTIHSFLDSPVGPGPDFSFDGPL